MFYFEADARTYEKRNGLPVFEEPHFNKWLITMTLKHTNDVNWKAPASQTRVNSTLDVMY